MYKSSFFILGVMVFCQAMQERGDEEEGLPRSPSQERLLKPADIVAIKEAVNDGSSVTRRDLLKLGAIVVTAGSIATTLVLRFTGDR